jgi:hypothetical protein
MFCDEALDAVERSAAGDLVADGRIADHLMTCPGCAAALEAPGVSNACSQQRSVPRVSPRFPDQHAGQGAASARWRSDQWLDAGFNLGIVAIVVAMGSALWMLFNRSGLAAVSNDAVGLFGSGLSTFASRVAPSLPLYGAAAAILATALGIWWWAEREA